MEEWKKVASQLDKDHAKGMPTWFARTHTNTHTYRHAFSLTADLFSLFRVQEGQSGHQEEVIGHHQTAEEGEER